MALCYFYQRSIQLERFTAKIDMLRHHRRAGTSTTAGLDNRRRRCEKTLGGPRQREPPAATGAQTLAGPIVPGREPWNETTRQDRRHAPLPGCPSIAAPPGICSASAGRHGLFILRHPMVAVGAVGLVLPCCRPPSSGSSPPGPEAKRAPAAAPVRRPRRRRPMRAWIEEGPSAGTAKHFALAGLAFGLATCAWALYATPVILAAAGLPGHCRLHHRQPAG